MKKKDAPVVLFPTENGTEVYEMSDIDIGTVIRIGSPSNRYYQYIHVSLDFLNHKLNDLSTMLDLKGATAKVTGMINLEGGSRFAVIESEGDTVFFEDKNRLFVDPSPALKNREVIVEKTAN